MAKKVLKFGGTSVGTTERILHVAEIIKKEYVAGNEIIAVVCIKPSPLVVMRFGPAEPVLYPTLDIVDQNIAALQLPLETSCLL